ncbi:hypothetical protein EJ110_NYTH57153 [Nymphaea thermarum]|nr:hypothetical protein EJ110_NYTH57153 [Nymphaea thermarum]
MLVANRWRLGDPLQVEATIRVRIWICLPDLLMEMKPRAPTITTGTVEGSSGDGNRFSILANVAKAYGRVNWRFLEETLHYLGFSNRWSQRIMTIVSTVTIAPLINGREGQWLLLLVFVNHGNFNAEPCKETANEDPKVTLSAKDDILVFSEGRTKSIKELASTIKSYQAFSSLEPGLTLPTQLSNSPDELKWKADSGHDAHPISKQGIWNATRNQGRIEPWRNNLWISKGYLREIWTVCIRCEGKLPTEHRMQHLGITLASRCHLCDADFETEEHLLFDCSEARWVWNFVALEFGIQGRPKTSICNGLQWWWGKRPRCKDLRKDWKSCYHIIIWFLWKVQNQLQHRGESKPANMGLAAWVQCKDYLLGSLNLKAKNAGTKMWLTTEILWDDWSWEQEANVSIQIVLWKCNCRAS